ncbi:tail fiber protein [Testudinibacter sp. P27/CKL/0425]
MANLIETSTYETGIYQLEKTDPVVAGKDGISNKQAQQLANRTKYLKGEQDKLKTATAAASTTKSGTVMLSSSVTSAGETKAATEKAVKTAYDRAQAAYNLGNSKANGTHSHPMSEVTGLETALATKAPLDSPALGGTPTAPTAAATTNTDQIATTKFVKTLIAQLVGSAPGALDTLQEMAAALGGDGNFRTTILNEINKKATKATTLAGYGITDFVLKTLTTEDLDTVKVPGLYNQNRDADATTERHYPQAEAGSLKVSPSTYGFIQEYTTYQSNRKFVRTTQSNGNFPTTWARIDSLDSVPTSRAILTGNGLTGGGNLGGSRTLTLGTPSQITAISTNSVTAESHTHAIDTATTSRAGIVQLSSNITGTSTTRAVTESAVKALNDAKANLASPTFTGAPKAPTPAKTVNDTTIATTAYVKQLIADLIGGAPTTLDTLKELSDALGADANLRTTLLTEIGKKANASDALMKSQLVGIPLPYPVSAVPSGFVAMTGQAISATTYPRLSALYGAKLPDLRGEFIRGWDNQRGVDSGRRIMSAQGDAIRNIKGEITTATWVITSTGLFQRVRQGEQDGDSSGRSGWVYDFDASRVVPTAPENRPRNVAMQYICLAG